MKYDKYNLLVAQDLSKAALLTSERFIESLLKKEVIDKVFAINHPVRKRLETETFEDYDNYLTAHTRAYETLLEGQGNAYLMNLDINFGYMLDTLRTPAGYVNHPTFPKLLLDDLSMYYMLVAMIFYGFDTKIPNKTMNIQNLSLIHGRKTWHRYVADFIGIFSPLPYQKKLSSRFNPTFLTRFIK